MDAYLVYDGGCGLCTFGKNLVKALDWRHRIHAVPLQDPDSARVLAGMEEAQRWSSFHVVTDGRTVGRGDGVLEILSVLAIGGGVPRLAAEMPALRSATERVYSLFHALRGRLQCAV